MQIKMQIKMRKLTAYFIFLCLAVAIGAGVYAYVFEDGIAATLLVRSIIFSIIGIYIAYRNLKKAKELENDRTTAVPGKP